MTRKINIENTKMPQRFKDSLDKALRYIEQTTLAGIKQVILFGSLARSEITCRSDIDLCVIFEDYSDIHSKDCALFKSKLRDITDIDIDVVCCLESTFSFSKERLFQHIRDEGVLLLTA